MHLVAPGGTTCILGRWASGEASAGPKEAARQRERQGCEPAGHVRGRVGASVRRRRRDRIDRGAHGLGRRMRTTGGAALGAAALCAAGGLLPPSPTCPTRLIVRP